MITIQDHLNLIPGPEVIFSGQGEPADLERRKKSIRSLDRTFELAEERTSKLKEGSVEIIQSEDAETKIMKTKKQSFRSETCRTPLNIPIYTY